jgi:hypothetical protein
MEELHVLRKHCKYSTARSQEYVSVAKTFMVYIFKVMFQATFPQPLLDAGDVSTSGVYTCSTKKGQVIWEFAHFNSTDCTGDSIKVYRYEYSSSKRIS